MSWADVVLLATPNFHHDERIIAVAQSLGDAVVGKLVIDGERS